MQFRKKNIKYVCKHVKKGSCMVVFWSWTGGKRVKLSNITWANIFPLTKQCGTSWGSKPTSGESGWSSEKWRVYVLYRRYCPKGGCAATRNHPDSFLQAMPDWLVCKNTAVCLGSCFLHLGTQHMEQAQGRSTSWGLGRGWCLQKRGHRVDIHCACQSTGVLLSASAAAHYQIPALFTDLQRYKGGVCTTYRKTCDEHGPLG